MHCPSCEVLIERGLKKVDGVVSASVSRAREEAEVELSRDIPIEDMEKAIKEHGYSLAEKDASSDSRIEFILKDKRKYAEIGAVLVIIIGLYFNKDSSDLGIFSFVLEYE